MTRPRGAKCRRPSDDRGSGSVLAIALCCVLVVGTGLVGAVVQVVAARHQASAAADLGALAAADRAALADPAACGVARSVVRANGATLVGCDVAADGTVVVRAAQALPGGLAPLGPAVGAARAGPGPPLVDGPG